MAAALIDAILEGDRKEPRKQRHTARRIIGGIAPRFLAALRRNGRCGSMWSGAGARWVWPCMRRSFRRATTGVSKRFRFGENFRKQAFVMLTTSEGDREIQRAKKGGASAYLVKSMARDDWLELIHAPCGATRPARNIIPTDRKRQRAGSRL